MDGHSNTEAATHGQPVTGLRWGLRESFLRYVSTLPDGLVRVTDGTTVVDGWRFLFPPTLEAEPVGPGGAATAVVHRFRGGVELTGHLGVLHVRVQDPWVAVRDGRGVVCIAGREGTRVQIATCAIEEPAAGSVVGRHVRLTQDGAELFGGSYPAGEQLEPFVARSRAPDPH